MKKKIIVVVDDESLVEDMIERMLINTGYRALSFTDPIDALRFMEKHHDKVDLLISDVKMPHMHGPELARRLSTIDRRIPVIIITGFTEEDVDPDGNIKMVLYKPVIKSDLIEAVKAVIGP